MEDYIRECGSCGDPVEGLFGTGGIFVPESNCENVDCTVNNSGRFTHFCCRCADTSKPACTVCNKKGTNDNSCSMCWLVGPRDRKVERCELKDCPIYLIMDAEDRCLSCWEGYANEVCGNEVGISSKHDVWTIEKCGHKVCKAMQGTMDDPESDECAVCTKEKTRAAKKEAKIAAQVEADVTLMKELVHLVESSSAKAAIQKWLIINEGPKKVSSSDAKRQKR